MVLEAEARGLKNEGKKREDFRDLAEDQLVQETKTVLWIQIWSNEVI